MTTMRVVGECFFWYRLTRVFPDKFHRAVKRLCVCVCDILSNILSSIMAAYYQVDDDDFIRSPNGSVLCHTAGYRYRPISVADLITDTGVTLAVKSNTRRRLVEDGSSRNHHRLISPRVVANLHPARSQQ